MLSASFDAVLAGLRAQESAWQARGLASGSPLHELPVACGRRGGMVLRSEARCELGEADVACACLVALDPAGVMGRDDAVCTLGPYAPGFPLGTPAPRAPGELAGLAAGARLPFGLAVVVGGPDLADADYERACDVVRGGGRLEGCMARGGTEALWLRVSRTAADAGVTLQVIGSALVRGMRERVAGAASVRVYLLAGKGEQAGIEALGELASEARTVGHALKKAAWAEQGVDIDCPSGLGHCGSCADQKTCTAVRRISAMREEALSA